MLYIAGTFFLGLGVISFWVRVLQKPNPFHGSGKRSFIEAQGVVTEAEMGECVTNGNIIYSPLIKYEYFVKMGKYSGNKIGAIVPQFGLSDRKLVERFLSNYIVNSKVAVFFNSGDPGDCYLVKKVPVSVIEPIIFVIGGVTGLCMLLYEFGQML